MTDTERTETETQDRDSRKGNLLLLGAVGLILIPVVVGWYMANTDSGGDDDGSQSGMGGSTAGATSDQPGFPVQSIDEILDGELSVEVDPSGTSAVLRLNTTVDVACSVVFGPTTRFGGLATDTDMAGGGHSIHQPLMTGLEPGTTVLYRVQGTAADGTIYVGDIEQFVTPSADGTAARSNLSLNASVVETSSDFNSNFAGANAIDGSLSTEWSSLGDGDDAFIVIDLGAPMEVSGIGFRTREMSDGTAITNTYTVSIDNGEALGPFEAGIGLVVSDLAATGQVFRIEMADTTGGNTGAVEIEIYGATAESTPAGGTDTTTTTEVESTTTTEEEM
jgi:hypothetical protein